MGATGHKANGLERIHMRNETSALKHICSTVKSSRTEAKHCRFSQLELYFPSHSHLSVHLQWDGNAMSHAL